MSKVSRVPSALLPTFKMSDAKELIEDFASFVEKHGIESVPLHDEEMRPLLALFLRINEKCDGTFMVSFEKGHDVEDKIRWGLAIPNDILAETIEIVNKEMFGDPAMVELGKKRKVIMMEVAKQPEASVLHHEDLWVPAAAIGRRRN